jgi:thioredoxin 1
MSVVSLDSRSFGAVLGRPGILIIEWGAKWCSAYQVFGSVLERMAGRHADVTLASVDVEAQPELVEVLGVQALPALMMFRDGFLVLNHVGALPEPMMEDLVRQARALDMEEVRRRRGGPRTSAARVRVGLHGM